MADEKHLRLQVAGGYSGTGSPAAEVWSFNLRLILNFGAVDDVGTFPSNWSVEPDFNTTTGATYVTQKTWTANGPLTADFDPESYLIDQVEPAVADYIGGWKFATRAEVRRISLYPCGSPDGTALGGNFADLTYTSSNPHGTGSNMLPLENSVVVSWATNRLGPRGKGRIYTPVPGTNVLDADGLLAAGEALDLADASATFLAALSLTGVDTVTIRPVVTGPTAKPGEPAYSRYAVVKNVRVGHVIDTQRRRRNKEDEDYTVEAVSY